VTIGEMEGRVRETNILKGGLIQNVLERKDSMAVLPTGFGKSMCYVHLPLILDKVRSYMQIISHDTLR
jgi:superfamily II DNA helicase RecQ